MAQEKPEVGVYRCAHLINGSPAYVVVDWHGVESEERLVAEWETEEDVIEELSNALWLTRPKRGKRGEPSSARGQRPSFLRLM